ncbi:death-on-curing family protein [Notoacmeibacter marinus]|uniref:Death-on-curing family protein n=1 Tax=Notoacmeibacter marinus TaxID=1876515 RepID=A0A231UU74_9HYPH|nr:type II toxin-antitoxin system death-on-curing family toxin [Notoacmeibacter marinus]OXS99484.1 death-on-curing family protein [Notoacmeibacter marinus]
MTDWQWLSRQAIEIVHDEQLREHGGLPGLKDENALEASLARPINKAAYRDPDAFELAASYLYGLAKNHPFSDGNKRIAFLAAYMFLRLHGYRIEASQAVVIAFVLGVAAGEIDEEGAMRFLRDHAVTVEESE